MTGDDVKGTFLRMNDPNAAFQVFGTTYYDGIEGVTEYKEGKADDISGITVDGNNVTFHADEARRWLPQRPGDDVRVHRARRRAAHRRPTCRRR